MGTSQSSVGPNGRSPLLPAWVDDSQVLPQTPEPQQLKGFRQAIGRAVQGGGREDVRKALGHYARKASGGKHIAVQKSGKITQAGAGLFGIFSGSQQQLSQVQSHKHGFLIVPDFFVHLYFHKLSFLSPVLFLRFLWFFFRYFYPGKSTVFRNAFRIKFRKSCKVKRYLLIGCIS